MKHHAVMKINSSQLSDKRNSMLFCRSSNSNWKFLICNEMYISLLDNYRWFELFCICATIQSALTDNLCYSCWPLFWKISLIYKCFADHGILGYWLILYSTTACHRAIQRHGHTSVGHNVAKGSDIDLRSLLLVWNVIITQYKHSCFSRDMLGYRRVF